MLSQDSHDEGVLKSWVSKVGTRGACKGGVGALRRVSFFAADLVCLDMLVLSCKHLWFVKGEDLWRWNAMFADRNDTRPKQITAYNELPELLLLYRSSLMMKKKISN